MPPKYNVFSQLLKKYLYTNFHLGNFPEDCVKKLFIGKTSTCVVTMANTSSFSVPNCNEQSSAPVFKTPSPFWNQDSVFRRPKHIRESTSDVTDGFPLYPYGCDFSSLRNPDISYATGLNQIYSSMNPSSTYITPSSKLLVSDPNALHGIGRGTYHWSYLASGVEDGFRNLHNPQIDPFLASYYYRGAVRDVLQGDVSSEKTESGMKNNKRARGEKYWYHRPQKQGILHSFRKDSARHCVKNNPLLGSLLYTDTNKNNNHNPNLNHFSPATPVSKRNGENQTREELPLLDWREDADKNNHQTNTSTQTSSSVLCVLHRFVEGSLVELESGRLKRIEDLQMEDLEQCAELHPDLKLERLTVLKIMPSHKPALLLHVTLERDHSQQLSLEVNEGLPFFVCGRGWSSCNPQLTSQTCRLQCHQLKVGDICLALTRDPAPEAQPANQSPAEMSMDHTVPKCDIYKTSTLSSKDKSRKRHLTAPELRDISKIHQSTD
nr:uncharacterized protein LOC129427259 isoform X1 [Misgurnus anguillicaudatus]